MDETGTTPQQACEQATADRLAAVARRDAAEAKHSAAQAHVTAMRSRYLDGDATVAPADIEAAEREERHAALAVEAAGRAHGRCVEQERIAAWPAFAAEHMDAALAEPEADLRAELDDIAQEAREALAAIEKRLEKAVGPAKAHNAAVAAVYGWLTGGGHHDPDDLAGCTQNTDWRLRAVYYRGRAGLPVDTDAILDEWAAQLGDAGQRLSIVRRED
jgi:hypothetical protein